MNTWKSRLMQWLSGRYGADRLSKACTITVLALLLLSLIPPLSFCALPAAAIMLWDLFRSFSRNFSARRKEEAVYLRLTKPIRDAVTLHIRIVRERKTHVYFRCPQCKAMLRVPRGRGEITVTCPQCHTKTDKTT